MLMASLEQILCLCWCYTTDINLQKDLSAFHALLQSDIATEGTSKLAAFFGKTSEVFDRIQKLFKLPKNTLERLSYLERVLDLVQKIGSVDLLGNSVSATYQNQINACAAIKTHIGILPNLVKSKLGLAEDKLLESKRTALVDFLINGLESEFNAESDLYHYFLLDYRIKWMR